jgi:negative regulator of flagellin synthesis FlgM
MRIDALNKISELYKTNSVKSTAKTKSGSFHDMLEISQTGKDYQIAKQVVARTPDVREDLVNDIKKRMEAGTYNVTDEELADKIMNRFFDDNCE